MIDSYRLKNWLSWPLVRAHLCTFAVSLSFNSTWRAPREAFRYGGLPFALVLTAMVVIVALPATLLQLAIGQLSQQDSVGVWKAVPFFRGVGYLRLLISFLGSVYTVVYVALTLVYFLYTSSNSIPFLECRKFTVTLPSDEYGNLFNASRCLSETFMAPVGEQPEYFIAVALIIVVLTIVFPFVLYNPVKMMKRIFYVCGPVVLILGIIVVSSIGDPTGVLMLQKSEDWRNLLEPDIWYSALVQALLSSQIAGGYLISAGDTVYSNTNVQWTALAFVGTNIVTSWAGLLFWYAISGNGTKDVTSVAVLVQIYNAAEEKNLSKVWPLLAFAALFFSGFITMLTLLYPLHDRFRRVGGYKWRITSVVISLVGATVALAVLAGRLEAMKLLEDNAVPYLISLSTVLEIVAFVFIYGWKILVEDVEFLTGQELVKYWVIGWCVAPGIITSFTIWWLVMAFINNTIWLEPPWITSTLVASAGLALIILLVFALISVAKQVQYDFIGKLTSSFRPSRHWGPRDPITHYYWLARREEVERGNLPRTRYNRRQLGQLSGGASFLNIPENINGKAFTVDVKRRANSDDWLYTGYRRQCLAEVFHEYLAESRKRSKSLDWIILSKEILNDTGMLQRTLGHSKCVTPCDSIDSIQEDNNNVTEIKSIKREVKFK